jgi:hypothetical protein
VKAAASEVKVAAPAAELQVNTPPVPSTEPKVAKKPGKKAVSKKD